MFRAIPFTVGRGELNFEELKFKISWLLKVLFSKVVCGISECLFRSFQN
jgi:hypothetical protein